MEAKEEKRAEQGVGETPHPARSGWQAVVRRAGDVCGRDVSHDVGGWGAWKERRTLGSGRDGRTLNAGRTTWEDPAGSSPSKTGVVMLRS